MKAAFFYKYGLENLHVREYPEPQVTESNDVIIKTKMIGVNPIDYFTVTGKHGLNTDQLLESKPIPHIPGVEIAGVVEKIGDKVNNVSVGDRVVVYNRYYDSSCVFCRSGQEMLCINGGLIGVVSNGGFAQYLKTRAENIFVIPKDISWNMAASLSVNALTSYHCLNRSNLKPNEFFLIFGATGGTGQFAIQLGKMRNANVMAISKKKWISDFQPDLIISDYSDIPFQVKEYTHNKMADVVLNSLGKGTWKDAISCLGTNGRLMTFGVLTGNKVELNLQTLYFKQLQIIGSTGGGIEEFKNIIDLSKELKVKVWKEFSLEQSVEALYGLFDQKRDGRIFIKID